ncbi:MAG: hypothetical protein KJ630_07770 [Proteobacteria bacterium]|nr:hypothetical protein [Pseudomonadota bacterium]
MPNNGSVVTVRGSEVLMACGCHHRPPQHLRGGKSPPCGGAAPGKGTVVIARYQTHHKGSSLQARGPRPSEIDESWCFLNDVIGKGLLHPKIVGVKGDQACRI